MKQKRAVMSRPFFLLKFNPQASGGMSIEVTKSEICFKLFETTVLFDLNSESEPSNSATFSVRLATVFSNSMFLVVSLTHSSL